MSTLLGLILLESYILVKMADYLLTSILCLLVTTLPTTVWGQAPSISEYIVRCHNVVVLRSDMISHFS